MVALLLIRATDHSIINNLDDGLNQYPSHTKGSLFFFLLLLSLLSIHIIYIKKHNRQLSLIIVNNYNTLWISINSFSIIIHCCL